MKFIKTFEQHSLIKGQWQPLAEDQREWFADSILSLIQNSYKDIGGHYKIRDLEDVIRHSDYDVWEGIDLDGDNDLEVVSFSEETPYGEKGAGFGQDGSKAAKIAAIVKTEKTLKTVGHYAEMSGAIAHLMLKHNVPYITDQERVEEIIGKPVQWLGENPEGGFEGSNGWYARTVQGKPVMKILLGIPLQRKKQGN